MMQEFWRRRDIEVENRRKEHEIKVDIVSKMDETAMRQIRKALSLTSKQKQKKRLTKDEQDAEFENINNWYTLEAKGIQSKLNTYFPGTNLDDKWDTYARTLLDFIIALSVYFSESDPQNAVKPYARRICEYIKSTVNEKHGDDLITIITSDFNAGTELVSEVIAMFLGRGEYIKRDIMEARIKIF